MNKNKNISNNSGHTLEKMRFVAVLVYILADFGNSILYQTFSPIAAQLARVYNLRNIQVTLVSGIMLFLNPFASFPANSVLDKKGPQYSVKLGCILTMIGAWLRVLVNVNFNFAIVGSVFAALGGPLIYTSNCKIGANWFLPKDVVRVTTSITLMGTINGVIGVLIPGLYFSSYNVIKDTPITLQEIEEGKTLTFNLCFREALLITIVHLFVLILFKGKPKTPPSYIAQMKRDTVFVAWKKLARNKNYILILLSIGFNIGAIHGISNVIAFLILPFGFEQTDASYFSISLIIFGVLGSVMLGFFIKKYRYYRKSLIAAGFFSSLAIFSLIGLLQTRNIWIALIGSSLAGFFTSPQIPTIYEYSCETVFPVSEGSAVGFLQASIAIFGIIYLIILSFIFESKSAAESTTTLLIIGTSIQIGIWIIYFSKEEYNRLKAEIQADLKERLTQAENQKEKMIEIKTFNRQESMGRVDKQNQGAGLFYAFGEDKFNENSELYKFNLNLINQNTNNTTSDNNNSNQQAVNVSVESDRNLTTSQQLQQNMLNQSQQKKQVFFKSKQIKIDEDEEENAGTFKIFSIDQKKIDSQRLGSIDLSDQFHVQNNAVFRQSDITEPPVFRISNNQPQQQLIEQPFNEETNIQQSNEQQQQKIQNTNSEALVTNTNTQPQTQQSEQNAQLQQINADQTLQQGIIKNQDL